MRDATFASMSQESYTQWFLNHHFSDKTLTTKVDSLAFSNLEKSFQAFTDWPPGVPKPLPPRWRPGHQSCVGWWWLMLVVSVHCFFVASQFSWRKDNFNIFNSFLVSTWRNCTYTDPQQDYQSIPPSGMQRNTSRRRRTKLSHPKSEKPLRHLQIMKRKTPRVCLRTLLRRRTGLKSRFV